MVRPAEARTGVRLVVDASTLVAELLRERGRALFQREELEFLVSEHVWEETERHLRKRAVEVRQKIGMKVDELLEAAFEVVRQRIQFIPLAVYAQHEAVARSRIRDERDWPTVALALATDAAILTSDKDFLGSGIATWTYDTLAAELARRSSEDRTR